MGSEARESPPEIYIFPDQGGPTTPEMDFFRLSGGRSPPDFFKTKLLGGIKKGSKVHFSRDFRHFDNFACQNNPAEAVLTPPKIA